MLTFSEIAEQIKLLETDQLHELKIIISTIINERKTAEILRHHNEAVDNFEAGKLQSYKNTEEVSAALNALLEESKGEENFSNRLPYRIIL